MRKRLLNQTAVTGYGFLVLSLVPYFQEGAKMNLTSWVLVAVGVVLVLYGVINPRRRLGYQEMKNIVVERNKYLPDIKKDLAKYLERAELLANNSELYDLEVYKSELGNKDEVRSSRIRVDLKMWGLKVFGHAFGTKDKRRKEIGLDTNSKEQVRENEVLYSKIAAYLEDDNIILARIKQDDLEGEDSIRQIKMRLESNASKVHDKRLNSYIKKVYAREHLVQSCAVFLKLSRDKFRKESRQALSERKIEMREERKLREWLKEEIDKVNAHIDSLSRGDDLE